jgi:hypothetical protein
MTWIPVADEAAVEAMMMMAQCSLLLPVEKGEGEWGSDESAQPETLE